MPVLSVMPNPFRGGLSRVVLAGDGGRRVWALDYSTLFNNPSLLSPVAPQYALTLRLWKWGGAVAMLASIVASLLWAWWAFIAGVVIQFLLWKGGQTSAASFALRCGAANPGAAAHLHQHGLAWIIDPPEEVEDFWAVHSGKAQKGMEG
jgi:hypothetical protein